MLTSVQKKLLVLLKEIDELCTQNDIVYYLGGGCLLGAVRSGGFLPWDDDADIHMTRENAFKFLALADKLPANRIIYRGEKGYESAPVHWRYVDTGTSCTGRDAAVFGTPAGIFVDIFIMDPVNCDDEGKDKIYRNFLLFLEYRDKYKLSWIFPDEKLVRDYKELKEREKTAGFENIKREMEESFWSESDGNNYLIRCPLAHILPKDSWGIPKRVPFEDTFINIPEKSEELLYLGYGSRWGDIPLMGDRETHPYIMDMDIPYTIYNGEAKELKENNDEIKSLYRNIKQSFFEMFPSQLTEHKKDLHLQTILFTKKTERLLKAEKKDLSTLVTDLEINTLETIFSDFYTIQFSVGNKWGVYMDIPEEYLYAAVYPLLYKGEFEKTGDILKRYMNYDVSYQSERLQKIKELCDDAITITNLIYVYKDPGSARKLAERYLPEWSWTLFMARIDALLCLSDESDLNAQKDRIRFYLGSFPRDGELLAYYADALFAEGKTEDAVFMYKKALSTLRNGLVIKHIRNRLNELGAPEKSI